MKLRRLMAHLFIHAIVATYMLGAFFWTMPPETPVKSRMDSIVSPVFKPLGLWQAWDMFAPNPRSDDIFCTAEVTFDTGEKEVLNLSRMAHMGYYERYRRERWRKFYNDRMRVDERRADWPQFANWQANELAAQGKKAMAIKYSRNWRPSRPDLLAETSDDEGWKTFDFYTWQPETAEESPGTSPGTFP